MRLSIDAVGEDAVAAELLTLGARAGDVRPALAAIADDFHESERRLFASQGGGRWAPLAPSTVAAKARAGLDTRILHATGALAASLTGGPDGVLRITSDSLEAGTSVPHARFHARRRPPIILREQTGARWADVVADFWATGRAGGVGL